MTTVLGRRPLLSYSLLVFLASWTSIFLLTPVDSILAAVSLPFFPAVAGLVVAAASEGDDRIDALKHRPVGVPAESVETQLARIAENARLCCPTAVVEQQQLLAA